MPRNRNHWGMRIVVSNFFPAGECGMSSVFQTIKPPWKKSGTPKKKRKPRC